MYKHCNKCIRIPMYIYLLCQLRGPRRIDIPVAVSSPCAQTLVSNTVFQWKEHGFLGEMAYSRTRTGNYKINLEYDVPKRKLMFKNNK